MNEAKYYHSALETALLNGKNMKERIDARIAAAPSREKKTVRISPRLVITITAAATFLIASVTFAAVLLRNQAFKEQTNAVLQEQIEIVTQPIKPETNKGWQPRQLILYNDVWNTKEDVTCPVSDGNLQLTELWYGNHTLWARFRYAANRDFGCSVDSVAVAINNGNEKNATPVNPFEYYAGEQAFLGDAGFSMLDNPLLPGTSFVFTGKVNGDPFTLTYTFTEETYRNMQQSAADTLKEHEDIVNAIPDEGSEVNYHRDNRTLLEVAVNGNLMYFTEKGDGTMSTMDRPYSAYDDGTWPVIDGRISEFFYLGNVDQQYPEGTVYSTYLPYPEDKRPDESLISFNAIVFRYEWATGKVTVPKNEAEYEAWRKESSDLSAPYCEEDWFWHFDAKGETFSVTDLVFHNSSLNGIIGVALLSEQTETGNTETAVDAPIVTVNGVRLRHLGEIDPLESIMASVSKDGHRGYLMVGAATADLPDAFTMTVAWHGETVEIPLKLSDVILEKSAQNQSYYDEVFDY